MADIAPYTISVAQSAIDDLKQRLALSKFPDELDDSGWDLGSPLADVKRLAAYWRDSFDWRKAEAKLNELPQFTTTIQCDNFDPIQIHFIHKKSEVEAAIPLLFVHGWPGSFIEVTKILDPLTQGGTDHPAFHVVALSLPNFGFSGGVKKRGFALEQYAETCNKLMLKLGYNEYVTQGGDWGYWVTRCTSLMFPRHCKATHVNFDQGEAPSFFKFPLLALEHGLKPYSARERAGLQRGNWFLAEGSGYREEQSTKPQTLGYALADSPVGLLGWIYEKLHDWTDGYAWTPDEVCTWVSIYWFSTAGPAASLRIYYEAIHPSPPSASASAVPKITRDRLISYIGGGVKLGLSQFPRELRSLPTTWTRTQGHVVFQRVHDKGGHFAAHERPDAIVADVRDMFAKNGGAYGVVKGKDGYHDDAAAAAAGSRTARL